MSSDHLPIDEVLPDVLRSLQASGLAVLTAAPGAGKTTRVPPAILEAGLAELPDGRPGQIVVLQPRRLAARSAALRVSEERKIKAGEEVGYQVRHERRASARTRILFCTEGIFLRRLQDDPLLEGVAAVVFDEFHERSLDSDLSLALTAQIKKELRPDLRLLVMSATFNTEPVSRYLNSCPVVESQGRSYPVKIDYLTYPLAGALEKNVADAVMRVISDSAGHCLVFLPGVAEIRRTKSYIENSVSEDQFSLFELYGEMPLEEQQRVLRTCRERKIVLATNVAETSITLEGVTAVIDSGLARVNRLDPQLGLNRLELGRISRASADQRAGRAGRTGPGYCLRLWTEREHQMLRDYEAAEIARVDLSAAVLQVLSWGEKDPSLFSWFEPPQKTDLDRAIQLLTRLGALDKGGLTEAGRSMSALPLQPRLARLLLEGDRLGVRSTAALAAAFLSERSPFRRSEQNSRVEHKSDSDIIDRLSAIEEFGDTGRRDSVYGELQSSAVRQILRSAEQLERLIPHKKELLKEAGQDQKAILPGSLSDNAALLKALLCAFPDRVCRRRQPGDKRGLMVGGRGVRLAEESAVTESEFFLAVELIEKGQSETLVRQASHIEKEWLPQEHVKSALELEYDHSRQKVVAFRRTRFLDLLIDESIGAIPENCDYASILATGIKEHFDLENLVPEDSKLYMNRLLCLSEWMPELKIPCFSEDPWLELLELWCLDCASVADLKQRSLISIIQSRLSYEQIAAIEKETPERFALPGGKRIKIEYEPGKPPVLAVRIQELFGMSETPRIASSRVPLLLHLQAPNFRVQQITSDLSGFWKNTYPDVKKDLKARYPRHAWPDDPCKALEKKN